MAFTLEQLKAMSPHQRHTLYKNAKLKGGAEAERVLALLEDAGLPYSDSAALTQNDPITLRIYEIAFSPEATSAMAAAIDAGDPPMKALDPLLVADLGKDYGSHNMSTNMAGRVAAERMEMLGYRKTRRKGQLPETCVAQSAEIMKRGS